MFKWILITLLVLLCLSVFQCEREGGISGFISQVIVDTQELVENVKEQVKEKNKDREEK